MRHHRFQSSFRSRLLAASALLAAGCNAPVSPAFELTFEGAGIASCEASAAHDIRLMCDSKVRVRILDPRGVRDLVPPVCQEISALDTGSMEALSQLDIELEALPLGSAMVQVEVWRSDWIDSADCSMIGSPDPVVLEPGDEPDSGQEPSPVASQPAVVGRAWFEIGRDEHVRIPMTCPDLGQVNRFAAGCGLDVEISDLDRGVLLRQNIERPDPDRPDGDIPSGDVTEAAASELDLDELDVQYVLIEQTPSGGWQPGAREWMAIDLRDDGSAVWRAWPSAQFWDSFNRSRTVCVEVNERGADGTLGWPQVSCFQVGDETSPRRRLQASYLPPEDLQCLLAASGTGDVPPEGIVIGRVVEPDEQDRDEVHPAANVQVLPTPADLPRVPVPRLAPIEGDEPDAGEDVQYVSKEAEPRSPTTPACHVGDATATTPSGYFLSDASFPAHWQIATDTDAPTTEGEQDGDAGEPQLSSDAEPGRILVGGRLPFKVSIVRIQLQ